MLIVYFVFALVLLVYAIVAWLAIYTLGEAWRLWAKQKFRVRFRLHTFLIISAAACLTSALLSGMRESLLSLDAILLTSLYFPLMLGLAFLVDLVATELYQTFRHQQSAGMRAYRATEDQEFQIDETGEPLIAPPPPAPAQDPVGPPRLRIRLPSSPSNPWLKMYRP